MTLSDKIVILPWQPGQCSSDSAIQPMTLIIVQETL